MTNGELKDLARAIASNKVWCHKEFSISSNQ